LGPGTAHDGRGSSRGWCLLLTASVVLLASGATAASGATHGTSPETDATMLTSMCGSLDVAVDQGAVVGATGTLPGSSDGVLPPAARGDHHG
jgi:hypothetical protein